jgi:hypothetical protein
MTHLGVIEHAISTETGEKINWHSANFKPLLSLPSKKNSVSRTPEKQTYQKVLGRCLRGLRD